MVRICSVIVVLVSCAMMANYAAAQDRQRGQGRRPDPAARWAAIAKAADKADAKSLTVAQFIDGYVKSIPASAPDRVKEGAKERATKLADAIKSGDSVTEEAFVKHMKENPGGRRGGGERKPAEK